MKRGYGILLIVGFLVIIIDQITKWIISSNFLLHQLVTVTPFLSITFIMNKGAAFGFLSNCPDGFREYFFISTSIIAMVIILFLYLKTEEREILKKISFSLIIGGASGNIIDRIRFGEVIDFIDFHVGKYHWPAFNIADSAITIGIAIFIFNIFFSGKR
jgi:signal peptidase II